MVKIAMCKEFWTNGRSAYEERYSCEIVEQRIALYQELTEIRRNKYAEKA